MSKASSYDTDADFVKHNCTQINMSDDTGFKSFSLLNPYLKDNTVFFTGETHGVEIDPELELKFLKYFNKKAGARYYLNELSYSDSMFLNKYLETGDESILKKLYEPLKGTVGWNKQNYEKWKEVYNYNCSLPKNQKITVIGIDIEHQFQNAIWGMYSLIQDKEPPAEIKPLVDELKALNENSINAAYNEIILFSKKLKDSINQYPNE